MDFRGRVYPVPPHLSHLSMSLPPSSHPPPHICMYNICMCTWVHRWKPEHVHNVSTVFHAASDVGRAMLQFGAGYPLGERGLDWLKIHLVNLHGHMKKWDSAPCKKTSCFQMPSHTSSITIYHIRGLYELQCTVTQLALMDPILTLCVCVFRASLERRVKYADDMMHHIMDSADNPMEVYMYIGIVVKLESILWVTSLVLVWIYMYYTHVNRIWLWILLSVGGSVINAVFVCIYTEGRQVVAIRRWPLASTGMLYGDHWCYTFGRPT